MANVDGLSVEEIAGLVGRNADYFVPSSDTSKGCPHDLTVHVRITDAREAFGRVQVRIRPLEGDGDRWVAYTSVEVR